MKTIYLKPSLMRLDLPRLDTHFTLGSSLLRQRPLKRAAPPPKTLRFARTAFIALLALAAASPSYAKRIVIVDGCNTSYVNNYEGFERQRARLDGAAATFLIGGDEAAFAAYLSTLEDGDELVIIAHGSQAACLSEPGFFWNNLGYTGFWDGPPNDRPNCFMQLPSKLLPSARSFGSLREVKVTFGSCYSDVLGPDGRSILAKLIDAMGGPSQQNVRVLGFHDLACAPAIFQTTARDLRTKGDGLAFENTRKCMDNDARINGPANMSWLDNPPANRVPLPAVNQNSALQKLLKACPDTGAETVIRIQEDGNGNVIGYKQPFNSLVPCPGPAGSVGCDCQTAPGCGIAGAELVLIPDNSPPVCELTASSASSITITVQDTNSGLAADGITALVHDNATVSIPHFDPGETGPVTVTATKDDTFKSARVELQITDQAGNATTCDPVITVLEIARRREPVTQTFADITESESFVALQNGDPGLTDLRIEANGRHYVMLRRLESNDELTIDLSPFMFGGSNTITLIGDGALGSSALVIIADTGGGTAHHRQISWPGLPGGELRLHKAWQKRSGVSPIWGKQSD